MFGKFTRNIDAKNRIALPAKLRDDLGGKFYITIGMDNVIELRNQAEFDKMTVDLNNQSQYDPNARLLKRFWLGNTQEVEIDSQGRFVLPKQFCDHAAIQKEVLFIGVGNLIELWSIETYEKYNQSISLESINNAALKLAEKADKK